jgi:voltage-gated potassium channel
MNQLIRPLILFGIVIVTGVVGYIVLEGWTVVESLYMVAITLSTVGFREVRDISAPGRVFTIGLILFGITTGAFLISRFGEIFLEGQIKGITRRRRMSKLVQDLSDHYIVCGFGRVGQRVCSELRREHERFVVVEQDQTREDAMIEQDILYILGDAAEDDILQSAGIQSCKGVVVAVDSDADSVFVTLTARSLNASVLIVSEARNPESVAKLKRAGATRVVSPFVIAGRRMANMVKRPATVDFLDTVMRRSGSELRLEEMTIRESSELAGITLGEAHLRRKAGVMVLAIVQVSGEYVFNPDANTELRAGQMLIALGTEEQLAALRAWV